MEESGSRFSDRRRRRRAFRTVSNEGRVSAAQHNQRAAAVRPGNHLRFQAAVQKATRTSCVALHGTETVSYTHLTLPTNREV